MKQRRKEAENRSTEWKKATGEEGRFDESYTVNNQKGRKTENKYCKEHLAFSVFNRLQTWFIRSYFNRLVSFMLNLSCEFSLKLQGECDI